MCELAVYKLNRPNKESIYSDASGWKRGDVVSILEDGADWGMEVVGSVTFDIVKIPGVPVEKMSAYMAAEPGDRMTNRVLQRRAFRFDLDAHEKKTKKECTEKEALDLKVAKPPLVDPNVLGEVDDVLRP